jgi:hypothetical protein
MIFSTRFTSRVSLSALAFAAPLAIAASGQDAAYGVSVSMDYKGPLHGEQDAQGVVMRESDLCTTASGDLGPQLGYVGPPRIAISGADLGLTAFDQCGNPQPGVPCNVEVDAFSRGRDFRLLPGGDGVFDHLFFSVDEYAKGDSNNPYRPSVRTEGSAGSKEAAADVFKLVPGVLPGPVPPPASGQTFGNVAILDGDGRRSAAGYLYPGYGLKEPNAPSPGPTNNGSNADSLDLYAFDQPSNGEVNQSNPAFFSLEGGLFDPLEGIFGSNSAAANGQFRSGDILMATGPGSAPVVYARSFDLGLDIDPFADFKDDIDALVIWDNGDGEFQPSSEPYQWMDEGHDMILFSVRRGSPIIGRLDSIFGLPICEGDLLIPPVHSGANFVGGGTPGIFVSAEAMGLNTDRETGESDDLNSADTTGGAFYDCNGNYIDDAVDVAGGGSDDNNFNGIPDECEDIVEFCSGQTFGGGLLSHCPCGNDAASSNDITGCANTSGLPFMSGAGLTASGSTSVAVTPATFTLRGRSLVAGQPGLYFQGNNAVNNGFGNHFGDGLRCAGQSVIRLQVKMASPSGVSQTTTDLIAKGGISAGHIRYYQLWYRDPPSGLCGSGFNLTNGVKVTFGL